VNNTEIKTRHGLILQALTGKALEKAGFDFVENHQYDEISEVPDFFVPDSENPKYVVEVHQTEARNSFQMKTLRAFTAVTESKIYYKNDLISVNILFGDPEREIPAANYRALCGFFDVNIVPRYEAKDRKSIERLEAVSLELAATEGINVQTAAQKALKKCKKGVDQLANSLGRMLRAGQANPELKTLWTLERKRTKRLGKPPSPGKLTYFKRNLLRSLFFSEEQFNELLSKDDLNEYSAELRDQLLRCKLATIENEMWGDELVVDPEFATFLRDPETPRLCKFGERRLSDNPAMKWFFEDIRNQKRRKKMAQEYLSQVEQGQFAAALKENMINGSYKNIDHFRTWLIDLVTRDMDISLNFLSRRLYTQYKNPGSFGDPISHIVPRTDRFMSLDDEKIETYSNEIVKACNRISEENNRPLGILGVDGLESKLLELRINGVIKLQKLNPLCLVIEGLCELIGLVYKYLGTKSIIYDLAGRRSVGKFDFLHISGGEKNIIAKIVAVHDSHGDDKSKEWGARRRAVGYRLKEGDVQIAEFDEALFVLDGDWEVKHVARLHRAGWNRIIRLDEVEETLRDIFSIPAEQEIPIPEEPLPLAAEDEDNPDSLSN